MEKKLICVFGPRGNTRQVNVHLNGVLPSERLTPKMAERAAHVGCGHRDGVTVWDNEFHYGYRLYARSARKLTQS